MPGFSGLSNQSCERNGRERDFNEFRTFLDISILPASARKDAPNRLSDQGFAARFLCKRNASAQGYFGRRWAVPGCERQSARYSRGTADSAVALSISESESD